jgi:hypothetical protein
MGMPGAGAEFAYCLFPFAKIGLLVTMLREMFGKRNDKIKILYRNLVRFECWMC